MNVTLATVNLKEKYSEEVKKSNGKGYVLQNEVGAKPHNVYLILAYCMLKN